MKILKINKEKLILSIAIGLSCFVLAVVMSMQFKVVQETDITSIETMRETELRTELSNWKNKYEQITDEYNALVEKREEYQEMSQDDTESAKLLKSELENIDILLGTTDVEGEGIEITLNNSDKADTDITSDDLLIIVNSLRDVGAEAISINDKRIINMTDIVEIGNYAFTQVNGERILPPYTIKAIGNQTYLESGLLGNGGYVDELKKLGFETNIEKIRKVEIKKYEGNISTKYIE